MADAKPISNKKKPVDDAQVDEETKKLRSDSSVKKAFKTQSGALFEQR